MKKIPPFKTEKQERAFWETHDTTEYFDTSRPVTLDLSGLKPTTKSITIRLPLAMYQDLKVLANKKDVPCQSMMKMLLAEKIQEQFAKV